MSSAILHIKDAYYFEIPHVLWKSNRTAIADFPEHYVRLDPDYQDWEAASAVRSDACVDRAEGRSRGSDAAGRVQPLAARRKRILAQPFDRFLEEAPSQAWFQRQLGLGAFAKQQARRDGDAAMTAREGGGRSGSQGVGRGEGEGRGCRRVTSRRSKSGPRRRSKRTTDQLDGKILIPQCSAASCETTTRKNPASRFRSS